MSSIAVLLPDSVGPWLGAALVVASFATSFISTAAGLGGGATMLAILALILPPPALIPIHGVLQLGSNMSRCFVTRKHLQPAAFGAFALSSIVGAVIGGLLAVRLPQNFILVILGFFILWMVWGIVPQAVQRVGMLAGGAVTSVLTMFIGASGPFVAAILKPVYTDRLAFVSVHAACMSIQHTIKIIVFGLLGFAYGPYVPLTAAMIVTGFLGAYVGKHVLVRLGDDRFQKIINVILTIAALRLIWGGLQAYFGGEG